MDIDFTPPTSNTTAPTTAAAPAAPAPTQSITGNPMLDAYFGKVGAGKDAKKFAPSLMPANITRNDAETSDDNVNWVSWKPAWLLLEIKGAEFKVPEGVGGHPYVIVKFQCHSNGNADVRSETPLGECEHYIGTVQGLDRFGENMGDLATAAEKIDFELMDTAKNAPRAKVIAAEMIGPTQPLTGKFVLAYVTAERGGKPVKANPKKPNKQSVGKYGVYTRVKFFPVDVVRDASGKVERATPAVDPRRKG